jgi:putative tricarboxylic transport membrane protein
MTADRAAAAVILVVAVLYLRASLSFRGVAVGDVLGPAAYPALIGSLAALLALAQWVRSGSRPSATTGILWRQHRRAIVLAALLLAYVILLEPMGFPLSTSVFLALSTLWLGETRWLRAAAIGVAVTFLMYVIFDRVLDANLPLGILQGLR